jgi:hypothetical protein
MSCEKCINIVFKPWDQQESTAAYFDQDKAKLFFGSPSTLVYIHHKNMEDLRLSSEECHVCRKLYVAFQHRLYVKPRWRDIIEQDPSPGVCLSIHIPLHRSIEPDALESVDTVSAHCFPLHINVSRLLPHQGKGAPHHFCFFLLQVALLLIVEAYLLQVLAYHSHERFDTRPILTKT